MELGSLLFLLLVLACPLAMFWMMRGGHGAHGHGSHPDHGRDHRRDETMADAGSVGELRLRRAELDAEIARFEEVVAETKTPTTA